MDPNMDHNTMTMAMPQPTAAPIHLEEHPSTFIDSHNTPLYSHQWTPTSAGNYAATCIFLVVLAVIGRALIAFKAILEHRWKAALLSHQRDALASSSPETGSFATSALDNKMGTVSMAQRVDRSPDRKLLSNPAPFRPMVDLARALLFTVITGVSLLIMLAVMTMNVGYFCSVLAGSFIGELAVGRYNHMISR
ncbi:hypothetical protein FQN54_008786 [Arachnomyces sp. PD_36]|nr:hypothetical protein FQN54_008786 [Arachnomyces sp. PD_36]